MFSTEDQVIRGETLQVLDCVQCSYSFVSTNNDKKKNSNIFSDSKIAVSYKQGKTKIKCAIQFRMAPFVKEQLIKDFKLQPFSIKFDEATTSQVKKKTV